MHAFVGFAELAGIARMHGQAKGAAIDLRGADLDEFEQFRVEAGLIDISLQRGDGLVGGGAYFDDINSLLHGKLPWLSLAQ